MSAAVVVPTALEKQRLDILKWLERRIKQIQRQRRASPLGPHEIMQIQRRIERHGAFDKLDAEILERLRRAVWLQGVF